ncbi:MAG: respiratory nitrate reductase subunit gamma [Bryobacterales bacterium]|nr:respiratory nitrate reductase subunit gamma [Bryobacterales bacterium]
MFDTLLFGVLPYVAMFTFFLVTIQRYRQRSFSYSSLSSQFLENRKHFWSLVPFHYGILVVLTGHIVAFLFPRELLAFNSRPARLYILEIAALTGGLMTLVGLLSAIFRRATTAKIRTVTTVSDWLVYAMLTLQVANGVYVAVVHPWGSSWFAASVSPYLWSLARLTPDITTIAPLPWGVKLHIVNAYLLIGFFPFTRLVHVLVIPNVYLWRKPQVVRWPGRGRPYPAA